MRTGLSKEHAIVIIEPSKGKQRASCDWSIANLSISGQDLSCLVPIWMNSRARWLNIENTEYNKYWILKILNIDNAEILGTRSKLFCEWRSFWWWWWGSTWPFAQVESVCNIAILHYCTAQVQQMRVFNAQLEKEMRAEKKRNRKMLEKVHICIILLQLVKKWWRLRIKLPTWEALWRSWRGRRGRWKRINNNFKRQSLSP